MPQSFEASFSGHPSDWCIAHRSYVRAKGVKSCRVFHGTDLTGSAGPFCYSCHGAAWKNPHPSDWKDSHGNYVETVLPGAGTVMALISEAAQDLSAIPARACLAG